MIIIILKIKLAFGKPWIKQLHLQLSPILPTMNVLWTFALTSCARALCAHMRAFAYDARACDARAYDASACDARACAHSHRIACEFISHASCAHSHKLFAHLSRPLCAHMNAFASNANARIRIARIWGELMRVRYCILCGPNNTILLILVISYTKYTSVLW